MRLNTTLRGMALIALALAAVPAGAPAQTVPPPPGKPQAATKAAPAAETAQPAANPAPPAAPSAPTAAPAAPVAPETPAASGGTGQGILDDIGGQNAIDAIEKQREEIRQIVSKVRNNAQRFRIARAQLTDIISRGKCGGTETVLAGLDRQEADTKVLLASLNESCAAAADSGPATAAACKDERLKLDAELKGYAEDRESVRRMCPDVSR